MTNTAIDLGNFDIKYKGIKRDKFSAMYTTTEQSCGENNDRITIDGKTTYIGLGTLSKEFVKVDKDYLPQLLYAIYRANGDAKEISTNLGVLLPAIQIPGKDKLISQLLNKTFEPNINGKRVHIHIKKVAVLPESFAAFYALKENDGDIVIVDIGSRTVNLSIFHDKKFIKAETIALGVYDLYSKVRSSENMKGNVCVEEDMERLIRRGHVIVEPKTYIEFTLEVLNAIKPIINLKHYKCVFVGGGSMVLNDYISQLPLDKTVMSDGEYANVMGLYNAMEMRFK